MYVNIDFNIKALKPFTLSKVTLYYKAHGQSLKAPRSHGDIKLCVSKMPKRMQLKLMAKQNRDVPAKILLEMLTVYCYITGLLLMITVNCKKKDLNGDIIL